MKVKLGEIATIKGGKRMPKGTNLQIKKNEHPYLRITDFDNGRFNMNSLKYVPQDVFQKISSYTISKNDIFLSIVGTIGLVALVNKELDGASLTENAVKIVPKSKVDNQYLAYYLQSFRGKSQIDALSVGSTQKKLPIKNIKKLEIELPKYSEQCSISHKLAILDKKIELNNEINANLLELISLIQNEYSRTISNKVSLKSLAQKIITGKTPSTKIQENYGYDIPFVKIPDMHDKVFIDKTGQSLSLQGANSQKNKYLPANAIMVSCIGTPGLVSLTGSVSQTNQQINSLILEDKFIYWSFLELRSLRSQISNLGSGGTTINNLNKSDFSKLEIIIPDNDEVLDNFNHIAQPIFERIHTNNIEIRKLTQLKEALLNKLF